MATQIPEQGIPPWPLKVEDEIRGITKSDLDRMLRSAEDLLTRYREVEGQRERTRLQVRLTFCLGSLGSGFILTSLWAYMTKFDSGPSYLQDYYPHSAVLYAAIGMMLAIITLAISWYYMKLSWRTEHLYNTELDAMVRTVEFLREVEYVASKEQQWSELETALFRIRLARFPLALVHQAQRELTSTAAEKKRSKVIFSKHQI